MNRRSFLIGLAAMPVAGVAAASAAPDDFIIGIDGGGIEDRKGIVILHKRYGMSPIVLCDEVHEFRGSDLKQWRRLV